MTLNPNPLKTKTALINEEYRKINEADDDAAYIQRGKNAINIRTIAFHKHLFFLKRMR